VSALNFVGINFCGVISTNCIKRTSKSMVDASVRSIILWWAKLDTFTKPSSGSFHVTLALKKMQTKGCHAPKLVNFNPLECDAYI